MPTCILQPPRFPLRLSVVLGSALLRKTKYQLLCIYLREKENRQPLRRAIDTPTLRTTFIYISTYIHPLVCTHRSLFGIVACVVIIIIVTLYSIHPYTPVPPSALLSRYRLVHPPICLPSRPGQPAQRCSPPWPRRRRHRAIPPRVCSLPTLLSHHVFGSMANCLSFAHVSSYLQFRHRSRPDQLQR